MVIAGSGAFGSAFQSWFSFVKVVVAILMLPASVPNSNQFVGMEL